MTEQQQWTDVPAIGVPPEKVSAKAKETLSTQAADGLGEIKPVKTGTAVKDLPDLVIAKGEAGGDAAAKLAEKVKIEKFGKSESLEKKDRPLTNTERFIAEALHKAIMTDDLKGTVAALGALSDDLHSAHRVLNEVRKQIEGKTTSMTFQTGRDQDNNPFVQLQVYRMFDTLTASNNSAHIEPIAPKKLIDKPLLQDGKEK